MLFSVEINLLCEKKVTPYAYWAFNLILLIETRALYNIYLENNCPGCISEGMYMYITVSFLNGKCVLCEEQENYLIG